MQEKFGSELFDAGFGLIEKNRELALQEKEDELLLKLQDVIKDD